MIRLARWVRLLCVGAMLCAPGAALARAQTDLAEQSSPGQRLLEEEVHQHVERRPVALRHRGVVPTPRVGVHHKRIVDQQPVHPLLERGVAARQRSVQLPRRTAPPPDVEKRA
ncbi:MAG: hypothetical protein AB2A00_00825 [Myxococcota bacterium]